MWSVLLGCLYALKVLDLTFTRENRGIWTFIMVSLTMAIVMAILQVSTWIDKTKSCPSHGSHVKLYLSGSVVLGFLTIMLQFMVSMRYGSPREFAYYKHVIKDSTVEDDEDGQGSILYKKHLPKRYKFIAKGSIHQSVYEISSYRKADHKRYHRHQVQHLEPCNRSLAGPWKKFFLYAYFVVDVLWFAYGVVVVVLSTSGNCEQYVPVNYWLDAALVLVSAAFLVLWVIVILILCNMKNSLGDFSRTQKAVMDNNSERSLTEQLSAMEEEDMNGGHAWGSKM